MIVEELSASWTATDSDDNAESNAIQAAPENGGLSHYVTGITASYSAANIKLVQIKDNTTVIWEGYVHNFLEKEFAHPLKISPGKSTTATLAASGTASVLGKVTLTGYTK